MSNFDIKTESIINLIQSYRITLPEFQRDYVWNDNKKWELIESLIKNYPIGALTLYNDLENSTYLLVDGLQRFNTVYLYLRSPNEIVGFFDYYQWINANNQMTNCCLKYSIPENKFKKSLKDWYISLDGYDEVSRQFDFENMDVLYKHLQPYISNIASFQEIRNILLSVIDIREKRVPLIIYRGDINDLPELFTKINKKNVSLTPYEILHSMWYDYKMISNIDGIDYLSIYKQDVYKNDTFKIKRIQDFNVYMYLSTIAIMVDNHMDEKWKDFNKTSKMNEKFGREIVFDAFSTIYCNKSNSIAKSIKEICENIDPSVYQNTLLNYGSALLACLYKLNDFIVSNNLGEYIESKYCYLYLLYIVYYSKNNSVETPFTIDFIKSINDNKWFKDQFRQVAFFNDRIIDYKSYINGNKKDFSYMDADNEIKYTFDYDLDNKLYSIKGMIPICDF